MEGEALPLSSTTEFIRESIDMIPPVAPAHEKALDERLLAHPEPAADWRSVPTVYFPVRQSLPKACVMCGQWAATRRGHTLHNGMIVSLPLCGLHASRWRPALLGVLSCMLFYYSGSWALRFLGLGLGLWDGVAVQLVLAGLAMLLAVRIHGRGVLGRLQLRLTADGQQVALSGCCREFADAVEEQKEANHSDGMVHAAQDDWELS
jgi:hypothetical protein